LFASFGREPDHFVVARGGKALYTGQEFLRKFGEQATQTDEHPTTDRKRA
jgi:hypothetical protein